MVYDVGRGERDTSDRTCIMAKKYNGELFAAASFIMNAYSDTTKQVAAEYGVTTCELDILSCLMQQGKPLSVKHISKSVHYSKGMISRNVESLRVKGLVSVERNVMDRRAVCVALTEKANNVAKAAIKATNNFSHTIFVGIDEGEKDALMSVLQKMVVNLETEEK